MLGNNDKRKDKDCSSKITENCVSVWEQNERKNEENVFIVVSSSEDCHVIHKNYSSCMNPAFHLSDM